MVIPIHHNWHMIHNYFQKFSNIKTEQCLVTHVLHELATDRPDFFAECSTEHHALLLMGGQPEDILHVPPHI